MIGFSATLAHAGPSAPHELWATWPAAPALAVALVGWWYARGLRGLWRRGGRNHGVTRRQAVAFAAGLAVLGAALASPLDALAGALFSAHMAQHLALTLVAPPLLVLGAPLLPLARALPPRGRRLLHHAGRRLGATAAGPVGPTWILAVSVLHAATLWAWHLPALYDGAVANHAVHVLEHATLFGTALLFWWAIADRGHRAEPGVGIVAAFVAALQSGALAALLTFAPRPWFASHDATAAWGLGALEDQQLAGVLMWVGGGLVYALGAGLLFVSWLASTPARRPPSAVGQLSGVRR